MNPLSYSKQTYQIFLLLLPEDPGSNSIEASYWSESRGELHHMVVFTKPSFAVLSSSSSQSSVVFKANLQLPAFVTT